MNQTAEIEAEAQAVMEQLEAHFVAWTGNTLGSGSRAAASEALAELAAARGVPAGRYLALCDQDVTERQPLIDRLLIRTSWFMREPATLLALAAACKRRPRPEGSNRVTIWSAACASGEEPYSLAMAFLEAGLDPIILATDLSAEARQATSQAEYRTDRLDDLPAGWRQRYFEPGPPGHLRATAELRARVTVQPHNLALSTRPPGGWSVFDAIVCRNVLLYFPRAHAERVLRDLTMHINDDGFVVLSAAEQPLSWAVTTLTAEDELPILHRRPTAGSPPATTAAPSSTAATAATATPTTAVAVTADRQRLVTIQAARRSGDPALALALGRRLAADEPLHAAGQLALGLLLKAAGQLAEATSVLRRARFLFGDASWMAPYALAVCLDGAGDDRDALDAYRHAAALLEQGAPSGLDPPEDNEPMLASTALEGCRQRLAVLQRPGR
jgi:chemotaxis protein methyltransferase CheR